MQHTEQDELIYMVSRDQNELFCFTIDGPLDENHIPVTLAVGQNEVTVSMETALATPMPLRSKTW